MSIGLVSAKFIYLYNLDSKKILFVPKSKHTVGTHRTTPKATRYRYVVLPILSKKMNKIKMFHRYRYTVTATSHIHSNCV